MAEDVRAVANFVLDRASANGRSVTNMSVNKIVYFLHGWFLAKYQEPLVNAKIEAWKHGPVFRELYSEFRQYKNGPIKGRAKKFDLIAGEEIYCELAVDMAVGEFLTELIDHYSGFSASALRGLSHVEGGPWDRVWNHEGDSNPGMQISDELIVEYFSSQRRH